jgi:glutamate synthase domain-containing protein 3
VEGVGDHGCEYMTGGRVIILGRTGRNFAAGMSGGIAYVYDQDGSFKDRCNMDMVGLDRIKDDDLDIIYHLLHNHLKYAKSKKAQLILENIHDELKHFIKVIPIEYKRILEGIKIEQKLDLMERSDG